MKARVTIACVALLLLLLTGSGRAYFSQGRHWPANSTIVMHLELGSPSTALIDGSRDWGSAAESAFALWNPYLNGVTFSTRRDSSAISSGNGLNTVSFADDVFGEPFGSGVVAVTQTFYSPRSNTMTEADVVFNAGRTWNSYRGNQRSGMLDFRRVALHEFGHVLGLDHPDDHSQSVTAVMNSHVSNVDGLQVDDIDGALSLYGGSAAPTTPSNPSPSPAPAPVPVTRNTLEPGARLTAGQSLVSPDGRYRLVYQGDGNLVLYDQAQNTPAWWSGTNGRSAGLLGMQADGNLVIYDASITPLWMTGTAANVNSRLVLQSDGNLVVYSAAGRAVWDRFSNPAGLAP
jgi:hypothetical protein